DRVEPEGMWRSSRAFRAGTKGHKAHEKERQPADREKQCRDAGWSADGSCLTRRVAKPLEYQSDAHPRDKPRQSDDRIQITSAKALQHAKGAAEEDKRPHAHEHAEKEARAGVAADSPLETPLCEAQQKGAENQSHQLGTENLRSFRGHESKGATRVAQE